MEIRLLFNLITNLHSMHKAAFSLVLFYFAKGNGKETIAVYRSSWSRNYDRSSTSVASPQVNFKMLAMRSVFEVHATSTAHIVVYIHKYCRTILN